MVSAAVRAMQRANPGFWERSFDFDDDVIFGRKSAVAPEQGIRRPYSVKRKPVPAQGSGLSPCSNLSTPVLTHSQQATVMQCKPRTDSSAQAVSPFENTQPEFTESLEDLIHSALAYEGQFCDDWPEPFVEQSFTMAPIVELPTIGPRAEVPAIPPRAERRSMRPRAELPAQQLDTPLHTNPTSRPKLAPLQTDLNRHSKQPTLVQTFDNIAPQLIHPDEDEDTSSESDISCRTPSKNSIDIEDPLTAKIDSAIEELSRFQPLARIHAIQEQDVKEEIISPHPSVANSIAMLRFMMQAEYSP